MDLDMEGQLFALSEEMQTNAEIGLGNGTVMRYLLSPVRKIWHEAGRERYQEKYVGILGSGTPKLPKYR